MSTVNVSVMLFGVLLFIGCGKGPDDGAKDKVAAQDAKDKPGTTNPKDKPADELIVNAADVVKDLAGPNRQAKVDKYMGKPMLIDGVVDFVSENKGKIFQIVLVGNIDCKFEDTPSTRTGSDSKGTKNQGAWVVWGSRGRRVSSFGGVRLLS